MKAKLIFNLPEDREDFELACKADAMHCALCDFADWLRGELKYRDENYTEEQLKILELIREQFYDCLRERDVEL